MLRGTYKPPTPMDTVLDIGSTTPNNNNNNNNPLKLSKRRTFLTRNCFLIFLAFTVVLATFFLYKSRRFSLYGTKEVDSLQPFAERYVYQTNYLKYNSSSTEYEVLIISDMDKNSIRESGKEWLGILKSGKLTRGENGDYAIAWVGEEQLKTAYNEAGRGMELSELIYFDGKLLTCDDRTGIIFEILRSEAIVVPLYVVTVGNGKSDKGFKCEWMTVVNDKIYVGSIGKEFVKEGKADDLGSLWIKIIDRNGKIEHVPWRNNFEALRKVSNTEYPAYIVHEAVMWNPIKREWAILPRRLSKEPYDEVSDEQRGTNVLFIANEDFSTIQFKTVGSLDPLRGTSSFKFIPFRDGEVVQLKTIEFGDRIESFIAVVNIYTGQILMPDTSCGVIKYEGVEII